MARNDKRKTRRRKALRSTLKGDVFTLSFLRDQIIIREKGYIGGLL